MTSTNPQNPAGFSLSPLFVLAVCLACGILAGRHLQIDWKTAGALSLLGGTLAAVSCRPALKFIFIAVAFTAAGAFCFELKENSISASRIKRIYDEGRIISGEPVEIEGVLDGKFDEAVGGFFFELEAGRLTYKGETQRAAGRIRLFAAVPDAEISGEFERLALDYGARLRVACNLGRDDEFRNPGSPARREILDAQQIDATCAIKSPLLIEKIGDENRFFFFARLYQIRKAWIRDFREKFSVATAGIMIASLLGNKYFLDKPTAELFREGGTFHALVISGLHITFIGGLTLLLIRFFTRRRFWQFLIASSLLWAFSIAVGADVPVVRAAIMFTILLFSQVVHRSGNLLNALGGCVLVLLVWRPDDLFSQSFQLTVASVFALVACAFPLLEKLRAVGEWRPTAETPFPPNVSGWLKSLCEKLYWNDAAWEIEAKQQIWSARIFKSTSSKIFRAGNLQSVVKFLFEGILVSLIVQLWLLPLTICYFHRVSPVSILLNLWVGVFIALESFAAVAALILARFSSILALPVIKLTELLNRILLALPGFFVENDWASFRVPAYAGAMRAVYLFYFAPVLTLTFLICRWNPFALDPKFRKLGFRILLRSAAGLLLMLGSIIVFHPFSAPRADGRLRVDFLDVGQGDSALITFPNGETLLVDGGGKPNFNNFYVRRDDGAEPEFFEPDSQTVGETVVSAFLWERGLSKIDYILATHADTDHLQGLTDVAKNFRVRAAFFGRTPENDNDFAGLYKILQRRKIAAFKLKRGDVLNFGGARIEILYPEADESAGAVSDNNQSVVVRIVYGTKKFLLTGDIEKETERLLVQNPQSLAADVVKVAHHGSRTSSVQSFVEAVRAEYAIIPVGRASPFGHPHREVVERWRAAGAKVLTTGERGTISISTNGKDLIVERFLP